MKLPNPNKTDQFLAALFTILFSAIIFSGIYFLKFQRNISTNTESYVEKPKIDSAKIKAQKLEDSLYNNPEIFIPPVVSVSDSAQTKITEKEPVTEKKQEKTQKTDKKITEKPTEISKKSTGTTKTTTKEKTTDIAEKSKNFVTISYIIDKNGNFTSAQRIEGLRDRTSINKAIAYVKKNIKGKKGKETKGTYVYKF